MANEPDVTIVSTETFKVPSGGVGSSSMVMIYGEFLGRRYQMSTETMTIGRSPDCTISLADDSVSRRHCKLNPSTTNVILLDMESTNGTYVNDAIVSARPLVDGDKIQVGRTIFKFISGDNIEQQYHEEIYRLKTTDGLTGVNNKRTFGEEVEREYHRFARHGRPLSLLMIDIDFFKNVNDTKGHLAGDRILSDLAQSIDRLITREESLCRYGGEEFAVLLPECALEVAVHRAEEIRRTVERTDFEFDGQHIPVTVSIGVGEASPSMKSPEEFIELADRNLYKAKHAGRNRVEPSAR